MEGALQMKDVHRILYICYLEMINIVSGSTVSSSITDLR